MMRAPRAVLFPQHQPDRVWCFNDPTAVLQGGSENWGRLQTWLDENHRDLFCDLPEPDRLLVGGFAYDGSYFFEAYDRVEVQPIRALYAGMEPGDVPTPLYSAGKLEIRQGMDRAAYCAMVQQAREHIAAGNIYQINVSRSFSLEVPGIQPWDFFRLLAWTTQAPCAAMMPFGDAILCSSSPELFLRIDGRHIQTCPIKGTRPRDRDALRDQQNAHALITSPKEQAELVMITDLERNDLGSICEYGSVRVTELLRHQAFSHVHHMISRVEGTLRPYVGMVEAVQKCFPGGSITGAPKRKAMELIQSLEPEPRGIYTGALGYFGSDGSAQFNIAIRTCELRGASVRFFTGSGITWDSDAEEEFAESAHKAAGMIESLERYVSWRANQPDEETRPVRELGESSGKK